MIENKHFTLKNDVKIPAIGIGTWQVAPGEEAYNTVKSALMAGYRHVDTANTYGNEESVGEAIRDSGIPREEIFITTKLPLGIDFSSSGDMSGRSIICKDWESSFLPFVTVPDRTVRLPRLSESAAAVWLFGAKPPKMVSWQLSVNI